MITAWNSFLWPERLTSLESPLALCAAIASAEFCGAVLVESARATFLIYFVIAVPRFESG